METTQAERERTAFSEDSELVRARSRIGSLYSYVRRSPNSLRHYKRWYDLIESTCRGARALEIGCGQGGDCLRMARWGAVEVHGLEVAVDELAVARGYEGPTLRFFEHDLHEPWPHVYDLIIGRSVLHHLDYRRVLPRLYKDNLRPGGRMLFMEPLGDGLLMRLYWRFGTQFHTSDEAPLRRPDIDWFRREFTDFTLQPINYVSLPVSVVTWLIGLPPDNALTRLADRLDMRLAASAPGMDTSHRSALLEIRKPASAGA
jgi:SAM-dependent methyltransferase